MTPREFIVALTPAAQRTQATHGVPASVTIAQAALESGWGASALAQRAHNLFGVKADASWYGLTIELPTREVLGGQDVTVQAKFRAYEDWQESIDDRADFLRRNRRYAPAFATRDGEAFARAIAAAGYATDPAYADKLISIMRTHALAAFDTVPQEQPVAVPAAPPPDPEPAPAPATDNPATPWPFDDSSQAGAAAARGAHNPEVAGSTPAPATLHSEDPMVAPLILAAASPFVQAALPKLISAAGQAVPSLIRIFGSGSQMTERTARAAEELARIAQVATGEPTVEGAVGKLDADPAARAAYERAVVDDLERLVGMVERLAAMDEASMDRAAARMTGGPDFRSQLIVRDTRYLYGLTVLLGVLCVVDLVANDGSNFTTFIALLGAALAWSQKQAGTQNDHSFGSSAGSEAKNALIERMVQK